MHYLLFEQPARFLPQPKFAAQLGTRYALPVGADIIYYVKSLQQGKLNLMEQGAACWRTDVAALGALTAKLPVSPTVFGVPTFGADITIRPFKF